MAQFDDIISFLEYSPNSIKYLKENEVDISQIKLIEKYQNKHRCFDIFENAQNKFLLIDCNKQRNYLLFDNYELAKSYLIEMPKKKKIKLTDYKRFEVLIINDYSFEEKIKEKFKAEYSQLFTDKLRQTIAKVFILSNGMILKEYAYEDEYYFSQLFVNQEAFFKSLEKSTQSTGTFHKYDLKEIFYSKKYKQLLSEKLKMPIDQIGFSMDDFENICIKCYSYGHQNDIYELWKLIIAYLMDYYSHRYPTAEIKIVSDTEITFQINSQKSNLFTLVKYYLELMMDYEYAPYVYFQI